MSRDVVIQTVLEYLQQKYDLSDLEKDIISTKVKYDEQPFDRKGAEQKIVENNRKYPDIFYKITAKPGVYAASFSELSDDIVKGNLMLQIEEMCAKAYYAILKK